LSKAIDTLCVRKRRYRSLTGKTMTQGV